MKTLFDHIERVKQQPHHIRKNIAFGIAALGAGIVALLWFVFSFSSGAFALGGSDFADATNQSGAGVAPVQSDQGSTGIAGAAGALFAPVAPAHIEIVDAPAKSKTVAPEQTVIPF